MAFRRLGDVLKTVLKELRDKMDKKKNGEQKEDNGSNETTYQWRTT